MHGNGGVHHASDGLPERAPCAYEPPSRPSRFTGKLKAHPRLVYTGGAKLSGKVAR